ncbi:MAG: SPOR domain-containing protein [Novosphingobium sp.]|nr:SPOR domain-containing protein [Novosphingobium sp.]
MVATAEARADRKPAVPLAANGPAADYPVVLGAPFAIDGVTYTPSDSLNVDQVGYASVAGPDEGGDGVTIAHRTLPLPSYVEVTDLTTGRTILARAERRGPMSGTWLAELSSGAAAQLGITTKTPVRIRRVNPPEAERALLRAGRQVPTRMETPKPLLAVLMRRLDPGAPAVSLTGPAAIPSLAPAAGLASAELASRAAANGPAPKRSRPMPVAAVVAHETRAVRAPVAATRPMPGAFVVQAGAFSVRSSAEAVARKIAGEVRPVGKLWRVRTSALASRGEAEAKLAKVRAAGYSDARIQRADRD